MQEQNRVLIGESFVGEGAGVLAARHAPANPFFAPE